MNLNEFKKELETYKIKVNELMLEQFDIYAKELISYNEKINLTSITNYEDIIAKHFFDCLLPFSMVNFKSDDKLADVGSGAGFPGLVLKIAFPELNITLIEPTLKRCIFLKHIIDILNLKKIEIINDRVENLNKYRQTFDYVTARAVSNISVLSEISAPLLKINGNLILLRGKDGINELKDAQNAFKILNLSEVITKEMSYENNLRINSIYKLTKKIDSKYPRNYGAIKKKPL